MIAAFVISTSGCYQLYKQAKNVFTEPERVDTELVATFWDGPRIGPGMNLIVQLSSPTFPARDMAVMVDQNGEITLPYLLDKPVKCDKLTLQQLREELVKQYAVFIKQPAVVVQFGAYDGNGVSPWGTITVMGQVGTQGPVNMPPTMNLTVTKALQLAGGAKPYADTSAIEVTRCDREGRQTKTKVDMREIGQDGRFDKDMLLRAGDVVYVPTTMF